MRVRGCGAAMPTVEGELEYRSGCYVDSGPKTFLFTT
jgi:hypothetical protein